MGISGAIITNAISFVTLKDNLGYSLSVELSNSAVLTVEGVGAIAYFRGDVSGDGGLNQDDFVLAMKLAVGQRPTSAQEFMAGDLNGNGVIDKDDAHLILRLIHGQKVNP
jgi:hypothetical protein